VRLVTHVGSKTPAFASASGRVVLASHPPAAVAAMFGGQLLVTPTGRRLNGVAELQAILAEVRERGYAEKRRGDGRRLYARRSGDERRARDAGCLTALVPMSRVTQERRELIVADLRTLGAELSELVDWLPSFSSRRP
jgi:DNA-binding IclR family transcriptional regulator